jgi:hypothetical protein
MAKAEYSKKWFRYFTFPFGLAEGCPLYIKAQPFKKAGSQLKKTKSAVNVRLNHLARKTRTCFYALKIECSFLKKYRQMVFTCFYALKIECSF